MNYFNYEKAKHGDVALLYNDVNVKDINTYMSPLVRFFINIYHKINKEAYNRFQHMGIFCEVDNVLYFFEARKEGFVKKVVSEKFVLMDNNDVYLLRPLFPYDPQILTSATKEIENKKYDLISVVFFQLIYQITNERLWLGTKRVQKAAKRFFCSGACAYIYYRSTQEMMFDTWPRFDTEDFYNSNLFQHIS